MRSKRVVLDIETDGLRPTKVWCAVTKDVDTKEVRRFRPDDVRSALKPHLESCTLIVGHNLIGFDIPVLRRILGIELPENSIRDTLVLSRLANPVRPRHSIEYWGEFFGLKKAEHEDWSEFSEDMLLRCEKDVDIALLCYKHLMLDELRGFARESLRLEHELAWILREAESDGFYLERRKAHRLYIATRSRSDQLRRELQGIFPERPRFVREVACRPSKKDGRLVFRIGDDCGVSRDSVGGPFSLVDYEQFNPDSSVERVKRLLELGWKPKRQTPAGNASFDAELVDEHDPPAAKALGEYLMTVSRLRMCEQWLDLADSNGYVHGQIIGTGARTHRMAHRNPNLGNIPKVKIDKSTGKPKLGFEGRFGFESRDCWGVPPESDLVIVGADLSGIQLRALAHYAEDPGYAAFVSDPSKDIHSHHAEILRLSRDKAKTWIYAFLMGAGILRLGSIKFPVESVSVQKEAGKADLETFLRNVPGVKHLRDDLFPRDVRRGYMTALDGRRIRIDTEHECMSTYLQSFEKIVMSKALAIQRTQLGKENIDAKLRVVVHDEAQRTVLASFGARTGEIMVDSYRQAGLHFESRCPITGEFKIGKSWAESH